jgi:hypothetical protein
LRRNGPANLPPRFPLDRLSHHYMILMVVLSLSPSAIPTGWEISNASAREVSQLSRSVATGFKARRTVQSPGAPPHHGQTVASVASVARGMSANTNPATREGAHQRPRTSKAERELRHNLAHNPINGPRRAKPRKQPARKCWESPRAFVGHHPLRRYPTTTPQFDIPDDPFVIPNMTPDSLPGRRTHASVRLEQWLCQQPSQKPAM